MTSLPIFLSHAHCSTTAPIRDRHGYPRGLETIDVPALTTIRFAAAEFSIRLFLLVFVSENTGTFKFSMKNTSKQIDENRYEDI